MIADTNDRNGADICQLPGTERRVRPNGSNGAGRRLTAIGGKSNPADISF